MSAEGSGVRRYLNDGDLLADGREYVLSKDYAALQAELQRERRDREHFQACWNSVAGMRDQIAALQSQLSAAIAERDALKNRLCDCPHCGKPLDYDDVVAP